MIDVVRTTSAPEATTRSLRGSLVVSSLRVLEPVCSVARSSLQWKVVFHVGSPTPGNLMSSNLQKTALFRGESETYHSQVSKPRKYSCQALAWFRIRNDISVVLDRGISDEGCVSLVEES